MIKSCHDHPASGGQLASKASFNRVRDRCWWPTMQGGNQSDCTSCKACQRRTTPHGRPPLPTRHTGIPVERPFQRVAIDLGDYKTVSQDCKCAMSAIDHLTRFVILSPICNKAAITIARVLVDRVFSVFGVPEMFHSGQGTDFENPRDTNSFRLQRKPVLHHIGHRVIRYWSVCIIQYTICYSHVW